MDSSAGLPLFIALVVAVAIDLAIGEPPSRIHPVAWFGSLVGHVDRRWSRPRAVGAVVAIGLPLGAAVAAGLVVVGTAEVVIAGVVAVGGTGLPVAAQAAAGRLLIAVVAGVLLATTVSLRMLLTVTSEVVASTASDPAAARESIRALVGRDTTDLSAAALRSAAVESAAENLADGFVAPVAGFVAGSIVGVVVVFVTHGPSIAVTTVGVFPLAGGVAGAVWVKAVNTLDSMLGYRSKPVGWASARLDDAVMYLPARLTAVCLAAAAGSGRTLFDARHWARTPDSPNSGWPMATAAVAVGVRLEKPGQYVLNPHAELPTNADAERAIGLVRRAGFVAIAVTATVLLAIAVAADWLTAQTVGSVALGVGFATLPVAAFPLTGVSGR